MAFAFASYRTGVALVQRQRLSGLVSDRYLHPTGDSEERAVGFQAQLNGQRVFREAC